MDAEIRTQAAIMAKKTFRFLRVSADDNLSHKKFLLATDLIYSCETFRAWKWGEKEMDEMKMEVERTLGVGLKARAQQPGCN